MALSYGRNIVSEAKIIRVKRQKKKKGKRERHREGRLGRRERGREEGGKEGRKKKEKNFQVPWPAVEANQFLKTVSSRNFSWMLLE